MPPINRLPTDLFADASLPTPTLNPQRSTSSAAPTRAFNSHPVGSAARGHIRQQHPDSLFASTLSRRPPHGSDVLADDADSDSDMPPTITAGPTSSSSRARPLRRLRHGSPDSRQSRLQRLKPHHLLHHHHHGQGGAVGSHQAVEDLDIVNRQADGSYLLGDIGSSSTSAGLPTMFGGTRGGEDEEEDEEAVIARQDRQFADLARQFFVTGGKVGKKADEEREQAQVTMLMLRLREQVAAKIEDERWLYEPVDRVHAGFT